MKAVTYTQNRGYRVQEVPRPRIGPDEILVEVLASSICGTDLRIIRNGHRKLADGQTIILGHEFAGRVVEVGPELNGAGGLAEGTAVGVAPNIGCGSCPMCRRGLPNMCPDYCAFGINMDGSHARYVRIPRAAIDQGCVIPLPAALAFEDATLIEPLSCAVNGSLACRIKAGETVVIFGGGPMGLLHLMLARTSGAAQVVLVEPEAHRAQKARQLGADETINPAAEDVGRRILALTGGRGADVIITACSVPTVQEQALGLLAPFGRLCLFGGLPKDQAVIRLDSNLIHYRNLVVTGVTGGSPGDFRIAMDLIATGRLDVKSVVSHVFEFEQVDQAFEVALNQQTMKVVIAADR